MATFKLTIKRGQRAQDVVKAAGSAISGSDAMELNVDVTTMSRADVLLGLDLLKQQIQQKIFPQ